MYQQPRILSSGEDIHSSLWSFYVFERTHSHRLKTRWPIAMVLVLEPCVYTLVPEFCWNLWGRKNHLQLEFPFRKLFPVCEFSGFFMSIHLLSHFLPLRMEPGERSWCAGWRQPSLPLLPGDMICLCYVHWWEGFQWCLNFQAHC